MTLTDFLSTANADDALALAEAQAFELVETVKIEGAVRKTAVETVNIFNGTEDRLATFEPNGAMTAEQQAQASALATMIVKALKNLFNPEFYINLADPTVSAAYASCVPLGVLTQTEYDGILLAGERRSFPFANVTLEEVQAIRNPGVETLCTHGDGSQDFIVSASNRDHLTFVVTFLADCDSVTMSLEWREDAAKPWKKHDDTITLTGGQAGDVKSYTKPKQRLSQARHLRLSYKTAASGAVDSVVVTKSE